MISLVYSNLAQVGDFTRLTKKNLDTDSSLETAATISLFTNARAQDEDDLDPKQDQGGWWGEQYLDQTGQLGSRLWLLTREVMSDANLKKCEQYAEEAFQWMVDAGVAASVSATAVLFPSATIANAALLTVNIVRPDKLAPRFSAAWKVQFAV